MNINPSLIRDIPKAALALFLTSGVPTAMMAEGFPPKIIPNTNGVALHTNTSIDYSINGAAMSRARDVGFRFARFSVPWFAVETEALRFEAAIPPYYPPGYTLTAEFLKSKNLRPIIVLGFTNSLYGSNDSKLTTQAELEAFERYCFFIAWKFRYLDPMFEIWNEPNLPSYGYTPAEYMTMVDYAIRGIIDGWRHHRDYPGLEDPIIIGPAVPNSWAAGNWFDQCLTLGLANKVDALSFHPYSDSNQNLARRFPETLPVSVDPLRTRLAQLGKPNMPIVITEWGWSTHTTSYTGNQVTEGTQAKFAKRQQLMGWYLGVDINCIYSLADAQNDDQKSVIAHKHYGLFKTSGTAYNKIMTEKPAVQELYLLNHFLNGFRYVERIDMGNAGTLSSDNDWCLVFWNDATNVGKYVVWTTETNTTKTTPNLAPLLGLSGTIPSTTFTDDPKIAGGLQNYGYTP